jgi:hypothetical protein
LKSLWRPGWRSRNFGVAGLLPLSWRRRLGYRTYWIFNNEGHRMSYAALKPKTKRIIESDLKTLFSRRGFSKPTIEDLKKIGIRVLYREIEYKGRKAYLSDVGAAALRRLTEAILELPSLADIVSQREVATAVKEGYNDWIEKELQPNGQEFADAVADALLAKVQEFQFLIRLDGLDIANQEAMQLGPVRIQRPDRALMDEIKGGKVLTPDLLFKEFNGALWLIGKTTGSPDVAHERFELQAQLTVGILAVCGAILFQGERYGVPIFGHCSFRPVIKPQYRC